MLSGMIRELKGLGIAVCDNRPAENVMLWRP